MIAETSYKGQIFANGLSGRPATSSAAHHGSLRRPDKRRQRTQMDIAGRILTRVCTFRQIWRSVTPANSAQVSTNPTRRCLIISSFQIHSSLATGQPLHTATRPAAPTGSDLSSELALRSAQTFPPTFPARNSRLSEQETQGALRATSAAQVKLNIVNISEDKLAYVTWH